MNWNCPVGKKRIFIQVVILGLLLWAGDLLAAGKYWKFPPLPSPHEYGSILINRLSEKQGVKPVFFPHWSHRLRYSCRVCHFELDFAFDINKTEITEEENRNGVYCGTCHDGKVAFAHTKENCDRCHTGSVAGGRDKFWSLTRKFEKRKFGNRVDWSRAVEEGTITPVYSIFRPEEKPLPFEKDLWLAATWNYVSPAWFPHERHSRWLDCANCHPDIFNVRKKTTENFAMKYILERKFCGVCHLKVAFPLDDCGGCHPPNKRK